MLNPYEVLGVPPTATSEDIELARHELINQHHPLLGVDPNPDRMADIHLAYATLSESMRGTPTVDRTPESDSSTIEASTLREDLEFDTPGGERVPYPPPFTYPRRPLPDEFWAPRRRTVPQDVWLGFAISLLMLGPVGLFYSVRGIRTIWRRPKRYRGLPVAYVSLFFSLWVSIALGLWALLVIM